MKKTYTISGETGDLERLADSLPEGVRIVDESDDGQVPPPQPVEPGDGPDEPAMERVDPAVVLSSLKEGLVVIDRDLRVIWANTEFQRWGWKLDNIRGVKCYQLFHNRSDMCIDCEGEEVFKTGKPVVRIRKGEDGRYYETKTSPIFDDQGDVHQIIKMTRDVTDKIVLEEKLENIYNAGRELTGLDAEALGRMSLAQRSQMVRSNVIRFTKTVMNTDSFVIRQLDERTGKLNPIIIESADPTVATGHDVFSDEKDSGIAGYVACTGKSYLCRDGRRDRLFVPETPEGRSSITVPLRLGNRVIGTFSMESPDVGAFNYNDLKFLEIFADYVAIALNTARLLRHEYHTAFGKVAQMVAEEVTKPLSELSKNTHRLMAEYIGHDESTTAKLKNMETSIEHIREILRRVTEVGPELPESISPETPGAAEKSILHGKRILIADDDPAIRESMSLILRQDGAIVELAEDGQEALDMVATHEPYDLVISDIKMPKKNGYEVYAGIQAKDPDVPIILMTAFGYDPSHSIVKAKQSGLEVVLFKPFKVDVLKKRIRKALGAEA